VQPGHQRQHVGLVAAVVVEHVVRQQQNQQLNRTRYTNS
jgi:hypothetical protein